jgi:hypothetical protein
MSIDVSYNHKSDFGNSWSTGSQRFRTETEFVAWMQKTVAQYGAVLITEYKLLG